jgi:hypothetical protein
MHECDVWIDLECNTEGSHEVVCSLCAKIALPMRPTVGEPLTFWSSQASDIEFKMVTVTGIKSVHYISTEVDAVAQHAHPSNQGPVWSTHVRLLAGVTASLEDAKRAAGFLVAQHGFEIDPYGVNKLPGGKSAVGWGEPE